MKFDYATCKCGHRKFWGSGMPISCDPCEQCGTVPGNPPTAPTDHDWVKTLVSTDAGPQPLTRCRICLRTRARIEREARR